MARNEISNICLYCKTNAIEDKFGFNHVIEGHRCHGSCILSNKFKDKDKK